MAKVVYEIDPDADTVIILKNPLKHFAVWEKPGGWGTFGYGKKKSKKHKALSSRKRLSEQVAEDITTDDGHPKTSSTSANSLEVLDGSAASESVDNVQEIPLPKPSNTIDDSLAAGPSALPSPISVEPEKKPLPADEEGVHYHVSSRHLKLASRRFNTMLSGEKWDEGVRKEDGLFYTRPEGWDADAFLTLMDIFHLRNRQVPRSVDLDTLAKIAVMVDYYECEEATEVFTAMWITDWKKKQSIPTVYGRDLMLWICVARVFDLPEDFEKTTSVALRCSTEDIRTLELPIWPTIVQEIELRRHQAIENVISELFTLLNKYRSIIYKCPINNYQIGDTPSSLCASFLLGFLTRAMQFAGVLDPHPEVSFKDISFDSLRSKLLGIKHTAWYDYNNARRGCDSPHPCNLPDILRPIVDRIADGLKGLDLHEFMKK